MSSTTASSVSRSLALPEYPTLRWKSWPLGELAPWSWLALVAFLGLATVIASISDWRWGVTAAGCLAIALWRFWVPVVFEIGPAGLIQVTWWRQRRIAWSAVQSYAVRRTGVVLFDRPAPTQWDTMRSIFLPYPDDPDDLVVAMRVYLEHAAELMAER